MRELKYLLIIKYRNNVSKEVSFRDLNKAQNLMDRIIKDQIDTRLGTVKRVRIFEIKTSVVRNWGNRDVKGEQS